MDVNGHRYGYRINGAELRCFAAAVLEAAGLAPGHAVVVADSLTQAELRGQGSHGVSRLLDIYVKRLRLGVTNPRPCPVTVAQKGGTALVDGDNGPGQVAGVYAMMLAIDLAHEYGVGCVAVRRSNHYGAAAFYLQQALEAGMIGLTTTNAPPNMPPTGGREPFGDQPAGGGRAQRHTRAGVARYGHQCGGQGQDSAHGQRGSADHPPGLGVGC